MRGARLVVTTGGTGLGPRDRTPEGVGAIIDYVVPGFGEAMRAEGRWHTPLASLSRSLRPQCAARRSSSACRAAPRGAPESLDAVDMILGPRAARRCARTDTAHTVAWCTLPSDALSELRDAGRPGHRFPGSRRIRPPSADAANALPATRATRPTSASNRRAWSSSRPTATREEFDRDKLADGLSRALTRRPVGADAADEAADAIEAALRARGRQRGALHASSARWPWTACATSTTSPSSAS